MDSDQQRKKKTTNEKPISLHPIPFDEAVRDLLAVKPPKDDKKRGKDKKPRSTT